MPATVSVSENVAHVMLSGEFDFSAQEELNRAFGEALDTPAEQIEINLEKTSFIDSSVIRMFLKLNDMTNRKNKSFSITHCNDHVLEIFKIGGFDQIFDIH